MNIDDKVKMKNTYKNLQTKNKYFNDLRNYFKLGDKANSEKIKIKLT